MRLEKILLGLLGDRTAWPTAGASSAARMAVERFSLEHVAAVHEELYLAACEAPRPSGAPAGAATSCTPARPAPVQGPAPDIQRWRGTAPTEDFNAVSTILQQELRGERAPAGGAR